MSKRFHPGRAAMAGVIAAELAAAGFDGPDTIIEGTDGFAAAFADEYDLSTFDSLGDPFAVTESYLKPYPCCRHIHGPIQAALALRDEGLDPEAVAGIEVQTYRTASYHDNTAIANLLDAQMSLPYGVAVALVTGEASLEQFEPATADRDDVAALLERITVVATDEMEGLYPETRPARVVVETTHGDRLERLITYPKGAAEAPLSRDELELKFRDLTRDVLPADDRDRRFELAYGLDEYDTVAALTEQL
jgi:2-methylcitrate dehydratase PrpD